jgi:hypothetical protein
MFPSFYLNQGKSKKYSYFPIHTDKNKPKFLQKVKVIEGLNFFLSGQIFLLDWPKFCKELATLIKSPICESLSN